MFRSNRRYSESREAGFTLIEALVALTLVAVVLTAIGALVASNARATWAFTQRLNLLETTRAVFTGLPDRDDLKLGDNRSTYGAYSWRLDVMPFVADFIDPRLATAWVPYAVVLRVQSPSGEILRVDTVRLRRATANDR